MANIDVLTIIDPVGFPDNTIPLSTPVNQIPNISNKLLNENVRMIAEHHSVSRGQATSNVGINVNRGDVVRWWDTSVVQDTNEDLIIVGFQTYSNWTSVMDIASSNTKSVGIANIKSGFQLSDLSGLKFGMAAFENNYIEAKVKMNAPIGTTVYYYLVVAKLDVSSVGTPKLKGLYRFDPSITVVG